MNLLLAVNLKLEGRGHNLWEKLCILIRFYVVPFTRMVKLLMFSVCSDFAILLVFFSSGITSLPVSLTLSVYLYLSIHLSQYHRFFLYASLFLLPVSLWLSICVPLFVFLSICLSPSLFPSLSFHLAPSPPPHFLYSSLQCHSEVVANSCFQIH